MKKYGKKYAPWLLFLFVAACLLTSTAAALPDSGAAASVPQAELEQALEEAIFRRRDGTPADVSQYNLTEEQLAPVTAGVLADNYADALVTVSYDSAGANSVSAMDVEMDSTLSMALDELDQINENSPEPMGGPELQTVYAHSRRGRYPPGGHRRRGQPDHPAGGPDHSGLYRRPPGLCG